MFVCSIFLFVATGYLAHVFMPAAYSFDETDPLRGVQSDTERLSRIVDDDDLNNLIYGSDDDDSLFDSLPDEPTSPEVDDLVQEESSAPPMRDLMQEEFDGDVAPYDDRPPIYDENGEEMKIPEISDEEFYATYGEYLATNGHTVQRSAEAVASAEESSGVGGAVVVGTYNIVLAS